MTVPQAGLAAPVVMVVMVALVIMAMCVAVMGAMGIVAIFVVGAIVSVRACREPAFGMLLGRDRFEGPERRRQSRCALPVHEAQNRRRWVERAHRRLACKRLLGVRTVRLGHDQLVGDGDLL